MVDLGVLEKTETMDRVVRFVTDIDNRRLPAEEFLRSAKTILGLQRDVSFDHLLNYFGDYESPTKELSPTELKKYGLREAAEKQQEVVDEAMKTLERMEREGKVVKTGYGQIVINIMNELKVGSSGAYVKYDGIINFTPFKSFAVALKDGKFDQDQISGVLKNKFQGKIIRDRMWIYNEKEPLELSINDIIIGLGPEDESFLEKIFVVLHISTKPDLDVLEPKVPKYRLAEEPEEPVVCAGDTWWTCAMLYPHKKLSTESKVYLYVIDPQDVSKFQRVASGKWPWSPLELRSKETVRLIKLGEIDMEDPDISYAFSRPCGNCGKPYIYCDDGSHCYDFTPGNPLKEKD